MHRERGDRGTTSTLRQDGEHFDNSDVCVLDMLLELAGGVFEATKSVLHIGWLLAVCNVTASQSVVRCLRL